MTRDLIAYDPDHWLDRALAPYELRVAAQFPMSPVAPAPTEWVVLMNGERYDHRPMTRTGALFLQSWLLAQYVGARVEVRRAT